MSSFPFRFLSILSLSSVFLFSCDREKKDDRVNMEDKPPPNPPKRTLKTLSNSPLPPPPPPPKEQLIHSVTATNINRMIETPGKTVLLLITSKDCPHCQKFAPIVDNYAQEINGKLYVLHLDADQYPNLARQYNTEVVPRVILFKEGQQISEFNGACKPETLKKQIAPFL